MLLEILAMVTIGVTLTICIVLIIDNIRLKKEAKANRIRESELRAKERDLEERTKRKNESALSEIADSLPTKIVRFSIGSNVVHEIVFKSEFGIGAFGSISLFTAEDKALNSMQGFARSMENPQSMILIGNRLYAKDEIKNILKVEMI